MGSYLARRFLLGLLTLLCITFIFMGLVRAMPGDPAKLQALAGGGETAAGDVSVTSKLIEEMQKAYGLDKPWYVGYWVWLGNAVRGDFGRSLYDQRLVTARIGERIGPTLTLSVISITLVYVLSIPLGLYMTAKNGRWQEQALSSVFYALYSVPSFVMGLYLLLFLCVKLDLLPLRGMVSDPEVYAGLSAAGKAWDRLKHLAEPVFCYTYGSLAYMTRFIRANMLEVTRQDYVRTARAKGLDEKVVFYKHAFRNSLIPLVTILGGALPGLLAGSVILERLYGWPGMGSLYLEVISMRDYPVIMAIALTFAVLVLLGNLLSDVLYALVDPRIAYS